MVRLNELFALCLLECLIFVCCSGCIQLPEPKTVNENDERTRITNKAIQNDQILKDLDSTCATIPVLKGFEFSYKYSGKHRRFVSFYFSAISRETVDYHLIRSFYFDYFQGLGWELTDDRDFGSKWIEFRKNENFVMISTEPGPGLSCCTFYSVDCAKSSYRQ
jgi:hypothetical protein